MSPEAQRAGTLVVAVLIQLFFEELLHENTCLWEAVYPFLDFDIDKSMVVVLLVRLYLTIAKNGSIKLKCYK